MFIHAVLDQPFDADGGVCRNDIMLQKCLILLTHGIHSTRTHYKYNLTHHRPIQDAGPVNLKKRKKTLRLSLIMVVLTIDNEVDT